MKYTRHITAPMANKDLIDSDNTELDAKAQTKYRSAVGTLQYYATKTMRCLAHPVARLAQYNSRPAVGAWQQLEQVIARLAQHSYMPLSGPVCKQTVWDVYSDSDHSGDRQLGLRSHTGVVILCNGVPVQWRSKKQPTTAISSTAAEIYALAEAVKDAQLNSWRAEELGYTRELPIQVQVDNAAGIVFQKKMNPNSNLKGMIQLRDAWVKELQDLSIGKTL